MIFFFFLEFPFCLFLLLKNLGVFLVLNFFLFFIEWKMTCVKPHGEEKLLKKKKKDKDKKKRNDEK